MKNLIYNIFGLLALLSICVMPAYTAAWRFSRIWRLSRV